MGLRSWVIAARRQPLHKYVRKPGFLFGYRRCGGYGAGAGYGALDLEVGARGHLGLVGVYQLLSFGSERGAGVEGERLLQVVYRPGVVPRVAQSFAVFEQQRGIRGAQWKSRLVEPGR